MRRTVGGLLAACSAPFLPSPPPALKPLGLAFHPDAFALAMAPLEIRQPATFVPSRAQELFITSGDAGYVFYIK